MKTMRQPVPPMRVCRDKLVFVIAVYFFSLPPLAAQQKVEFIPLPDQALPGNPIMDHVDQAVSKISASTNMKIPDSFVIRNEGGKVDYDNEKRTITYTAGSSPLYLRTGDGREIFAQAIVLDLNTNMAFLEGPLIIYQGDSLMHAENGTYDWETGVACVTNIRSKVNGTIIRGSSAEYAKLPSGKTRITIHHSFLTTEDVRRPGMWVGAGTLTVFPGDYGTVSRLSISGAEKDMAVPILGWMTLSHSLNPEEGYMPEPGVKSLWGTFLLNRYGFLIGNRRIEHGMPTADYLLTTRFDFRSRRGLAGGIDFIDDKMRKKYSDSRGLQIYGIADRRPEINPVLASRESLNHSRYRVAMQNIWDVLPSTRREKTRWTLAADMSVLSDRYVLQDYFEDIARLNDKPDNSVRLERHTPRSSTMLLTRFAPNDFYSTDERAELSYCRPRTVLGSSRVTYETRNNEKRTAPGSAICVPRSSRSIILACLTAAVTCALTRRMSLLRVSKSCVFSM